MAYNGSGTYSLTAGNPVVSGTTISSIWANNTLTDIATNGLTNVICKDGQTTLTANIPFGSFAITGLGSGLTARTRGANIADVQDGTTQWIASGGTADAITATYAPAITALIDGQICYFRATAANATTTPTFSPNGLTARTITKRGGAALIAGDIPGNLAEIILRYNLANTRWELLNPQPAASQGASLVLIGSAIASASATLDLTTGISSTYDEYEIRIVNIVPATDNKIFEIRISQAGVFKSGATTYRSTANITSSAGTNTALGQTGTEMQCMTACGNTAVKSICGVVKFYSPSDAVSNKRFMWDLTYQDTSANMCRSTGSGSYINDQIAIDGIRFIMDAGNLTSGTIYLYGVKKA